HLEESNTWTWVDRVRLIYLCVIMGVVMGKDEKVNIPHLYMKLAMDLEKLRNYPWGLYSFDFLLKQIDKTRHKLEQKEGYLMEGFLFGFQIWIMEAVPALGEICGTKVSKDFTGPLCGNWRGCAKYSSYVSREAKLAMLRNPVLRVVAKYLGHLLLGKSEAGSVTEDETQLIHYGLPLALRPTYGVADEPPAELSVNMGALFAQMLFERKFRGLRPLDRKPLDESIGSLLTRIFMHHGIDLSDTPCVDTVDRFDAQFFLNTKILHSGTIYRFTMPDGTILHCKLPQPAITSLTSVENMEFKPPAEVLYTPPPPASKRRRGSSSSGPAQTQCEDDTIPDISVDHTPNPSMEYLLPPYTGQFDSGAPPLDGTQQQQFAWTADTLIKLSTMMQTVWGALAKIRCPPTPSCCRAPKTSEAADMTRDDAENEPSDEATDEERGSRLHRSRRAP
ncbi:unnamed protein product, partial [Brassica rapa subsp. narinosa]